MDSRSRPMLEKLTATAWFPLQEPADCELCAAERGLLTADGAATAGELALAIVARGHAGAVLEAAIAILARAPGTSRVSVVVPESGGMWRVFASSSGRETHDVMIDSVRYPELSEVRRTSTPYLAPDVEGAPDLTAARPFLSAAGVRGLAAFPIFTATPSAEPVVLKLSFAHPASPSAIALATLASHLLLHRLSRLPPAEVAAQLGVPLPPAVGTDPGSLLRLLPIPAMVIDGEGRLVHSNARALWLLRRRGGTDAAADPPGLRLRPENPWDVHGSRWEAQVVGGEGELQVLGWSSRLGDDRLLVLLEPHPEARRRALERRIRRTLAEKLRELEAANALLEEHARSRARFVSDAAHELKTPLAILRSYLDTLTDDLADGLSGQQKEFLQAATHGARRLQRLTDELLDLAALESGHLPLSLGPVSSRRVVMGVMDDLQPLAASARVTMRATEEELAVRADGERLAQVMRNLIENGLKYTRAGGEVAVRTERQGDRAVLCVRDSGVGIPAEYLPRIFEEFVRVPGQKAVEGAGLGLAIVRRLVLAMGGRVWAESSPAGSAFFVELPLWTGQG